MVAKSISELRVSSEWEKRSQRAQMFKAAFYILTEVCCEVAGLDFSTDWRLLAIQGDWLVATSWVHGPNQLAWGSLFPLFLGFHQCPQYHHFLSLGHTRPFLFPLRSTWYENLPDFGPECRSDRSIYESQLLLYSLFFSPTILRVERDTLSSPTMTPPVIAGFRVRLQPLRLFVFKEAKGIWRNPFLSSNLYFSRLLPCSGGPSPSGSPVLFVSWSCGSGRVGRAGGCLRRKEIDQLIMCKVVSFLHKAEWILITAG